MSLARPTLVTLLSMTALTALTIAPPAMAAADRAAPAPKAIKSGIDLAGRNMTVAPGDDFEEYVNGGWRNRTEIPADRAAIGTNPEVFDMVEKRNAETIQNAGSSNPAPGSDARKIADHYAAFMDDAGIEQRGLAPLQPILREVDAISSKTDLARALGTTLRADADVMNATQLWTQNLFGMFVIQGIEKSDTYFPYLMQGGLGMPSSSYYLSDDPEKVKTRDAYRTYIADILRLANVADPEAKAKRIFDLETKIARTHSSVVETFNPANVSAPMTRAELAAKVPGLDWDAYFQAAELGNQSEFVLWQPKAAAGISALVASEPLDSWKDWLTFHKINRYTAFLPKAINERAFAFYGTTLNGITQRQPRWKRAIGGVNADLGDAVGKIYVAQYFPASSKADIQSMVKNIKAAFDKKVASLEWMSPETKAEARRKIGTIRVGVGYPENWRDYSALVIRADDPLGNFERASISKYHHHLAKLGAPVDKSEWWMTPQTVNAVNLPLQNALNFPAGILSAPFYDPNADAAANYGAIGAIIGHEISHSFDNLGAQFDAEGKLRNWWTPADLARFDAAGEALAKQYDAYEALPGLFVNGKQTLGENIADIAGLAAAYDGYHASLSGKKPPVIDGLTGDQRFFLAFARARRGKIRDAALRGQIATDSHSPSRFRAQTVRNFDPWYKAFDVKPGQKLYLDPDKRIGVW